MNENELYLKLDAGGAFFEKAPTDLITFKDMIKTEKQWIELGFKVKKEMEYSYRYKEYKKGRYWYTFISYTSEDLKENQQVLEAIQEKKKLLKYPKDVYRNRKMGITFDQIIKLPEHVRFYAESHILYDQDLLEDALKLIVRAISQNPIDVDYRILYFEIKYKFGDLATIDDFITYFENDIDTFIHSGHLIDWMRLLIKNKEYFKATSTFEKVNNILDEMIIGKRLNKFYQQQNQDWYRYKKEEFNKKFGKSISRIDLENRKQN